MPTTVDTASSLTTDRVDTEQVSSTTPTVLDPPSNTLPSASNESTWLQDFSSTTDWTAWFTQYSSGSVGSATAISGLSAIQWALGSGARFEIEASVQRVRLTPGAVSRVVGRVALVQAQEVIFGAIAPISNAFGTVVNGIWLYKPAASWSLKCRVAAGAASSADYLEDASTYDLSSTVWHDVAIEITVDRDGLGCDVSWFLDGAPIGHIYTANKCPQVPLAVRLGAQQAGSLSVDLIGQRTRGRSYKV